MKDNVSSSRGEWWYGANPRHTRWGQGLGEAAARGSLTLCMSGIMGVGRKGWSTGPLGISQPKSPPFLAVPEPSFWLTVIKRVSAKTHGGEEK